MTRLLRRLWSRTRLLDTCFKEPPSRSWRHLYDSFSSGVYTGRWGSLLDALGAILPLEMSLRFAWNLAKFQFGHAGEAPAPDDEKGTDLNIADAAIRGALFWAYSNSMDVIAETLELLCGWAEGCLCHPKEFKLQGVKRHERRKRDGWTRAHNARSCALSGCRAPELAAGALDKILVLLFDRAHAEILLLPSVRELSGRDQVLLVSDLNLARQHVTLFLHMKLSHWQQLPHQLLGIAHFDVHEARRCGQRSLALFDKSRLPMENHHALTLKLCRKRFRLRMQLEAFIAGACLGDLPDLEQQAARFMFVLVVERWIESRHAITKRSLRVATHASCVQIAWSFVFLAVTKRMEQQNNFVQNCSAAMGITRNAPAALSSSGLLHHPSNQGVLRYANGLISCLHKGKFKLAKRVIFHIDTDSVFRDYRDFNTLPPPPPPPSPPPSDDDMAGTGDDHGGDDGQCDDEQGSQQKVRTYVRYVM